MSGAHEVAEKVEEAGHGGNQHGRLGMFVGVTIATLGVLLAFSSAMVGAQRTELIATMVEQSNAGTKYQALSTKHRVLIAQLQQLHSLTPSPEKFKKWDDESLKLSGQISSPDLAKLSRLIRLENAKSLNATIPSHEDMKDFSAKIRALDKGNEAAREWTESFESKVKAHAKAAERYEWAQLAAEIGIVIASVGVLFMNRKAWFLSILLGLIAVGVLATTFFSARSQLHSAESAVEKAEKHFHSFNTDASAKVADEKLVKSVEEDYTPAIEP